jgi:hypothetical protein
VTVLDLLRLAFAFRHWNQPGFPNWGLMDTSNQAIMSKTTADSMFDAAAAVKDPNEVRTWQLPCWKYYSPLPITPPSLGDPLWLFGGGDIEGGSCVVTRRPSGACFSVAMSRTVSVASILKNLEQAFFVLGI